MRSLRTNVVVWLVDATHRPVSIALIALLSVISLPASAGPVTQFVAAAVPDEDRLAECSYEVSRGVADLLNHLYQSGYDFVLDRSPDGTKLAWSVAAKTVASELRKVALMDVRATFGSDAYAACFSRLEPLGQLRDAEEVPLAVAKLLNASFCTVNRDQVSQLGGRTAVFYLGIRRTNAAGQQADVCTALQGRAYPVGNQNFVSDRATLARVDALEARLSAEIDSANSAISQLFDILKKWDRKNAGSVQPYPRPTGEMLTSVPNLMFSAVLGLLFFGIFQSTSMLGRRLWRRLANWRQSDREYVPDDRDEKISTVLRRLDERVREQNDQLATANKLNSSLASMPSMMSRLFSEFASLKEGIQPPAAESPRTDLTLERHSGAPTDTRHGFDAVLGSVTDGPSVEHHVQALEDGPPYGSARQTIVRDEYDRHPRHDPQEPRVGRDNSRVGHRGQSASPDPVSVLVAEYNEMIIRGGENVADVFGRHGSVYPIYVANSADRTRNSNTRLILTKTKPMVQSSADLWAVELNNDNIIIVPPKSIFLREGVPISSFIRDAFDVGPGTQVELQEPAIGQSFGSNQIELMKMGVLKTVTGDRSVPQIQRF